MIRPLKKFTVKEWRKLSNLQEMLCKKFDIILTDHKTKREKIFSILDNINLKNIDKGIEIFNKSIQSFSDSMDKLVSEIDKSSSNDVKIWSDHTSLESHKSQDQINLEKIWGKKR
jgi:hypothetical protein